MNIYTQALYVVWNNGEKYYYTSNYISIIDVPYKRYTLIYRKEGKNMSKTIKVIDLLIKIANGEEVPEKINYNLRTYTIKSKEGELLECRTDDNYCLDLLQCLNDTVEIIEEEPEIDIQGIEELSDYNNGISRNKEKINELIRAIKQLDKKLKEN